MNGAHIGELMGRISELTGIAQAWKAKAEQQEQEIIFLRGLIEKLSTRTAGVANNQFDLTQAKPSQAN